MNKLASSDPSNGEFYDIYEYGKKSLPTLYFIGPYGGKPLYFSGFIKGMVRRGYRIFYLQPCKAVLDVRRPDQLGRSIKQAREIIKNDMATSTCSAAGLVGTSLGSYLGLNLITEIPFSKFIVVAGGSPILEVYARSRMFKKARRIVALNGISKEKLEECWLPFDKHYKTKELHHLKVLFLISLVDEVIAKEGFQDFVRSFKRTGVDVEIKTNRLLPHVAQVLGINVRVKQIDTFIKT